MQITEVKRHLDGREERFVCDVIELEPERAIVRFEWKRARPLRDGPVFIPAGKSVTRAYFWAGRHYLLYRMMDLRGSLLGHRFDVSDDVRILPKQREIRWTDLLLDLWVDPRGEIHVLDEDEVAEAHAAGLLTGRQRAIVEETRAHLLGSYRRILVETSGNRTCPKP